MLVGKQGGTKTGEMVLFLEKVEGVLGPDAWGWAATAAASVVRPHGIQALEGKVAASRSSRELLAEPPTLHLPLCSKPHLAAYPAQGSLGLPPPHTPHSRLQGSQFSTVACSSIQVQ